MDLSKGMYDIGMKGGRRESPDRITIILLYKRV